MLNEARKRLFQYAGAILLIWAGTAVAEIGDDPHITRQQWLEAVSLSGMPSEILYAMSLRESGTTFRGMRDYAPWPWVLNVRRTKEVEEGGRRVKKRTHEAKFFLTKAEAREYLQQEMDSGNQHVAVGMFQIHLKYNGDRVDDQLTLLDPPINLRVAALVLKDCGKRYEDTIGKLGCYYSGELDADGQEYAEAVMAIANKWGKPFEMRHTEEFNVMRRALVFEPDVKARRSQTYLAFLQNLKSLESHQPRTIIVTGGAE